MKTLPIITSTEYHMNQPSVFTILNGQYVGCLIYPKSRHYPPLEYWSSATCADSDRFFNITEKTFTDEEIETIERLQSIVNALSYLIPQQPSWDTIPVDFKIKRGRKFEAYAAKREAQDLAIKKYFDSIKIFDDARSKAARDLRAILNK